MLKELVEADSPMAAMKNTIHKVGDIVEVTGVQVEPYVEGYYEVTYVLDKQQNTVDSKKGS